LNIANFEALSIDWFNIHCVSKNVTAFFTIQHEQGMPLMVIFGTLITQSISH